MKLFLASSEDHDDIIEWMTRVGANDDDIPYWDDAAEWLLRLKTSYPNEVALPIEFALPIMSAIEDWSETLTHYNGDAADFYSEVRG